VILGIGGSISEITRSYLGWRPGKVIFEIKRNAEYWSRPENRVTTYVVVWICRFVNSLPGITTFTAIVVVFKKGVK
jgi:hypothetical protein